MQNPKQKKTQFVDQYRKISTLQKLPPLQYSISSIFKEKDHDQKKFMRIKKQPETTLSQDPTESLLLNNNLVQQAVDNLLQKQKKLFNQKNDQVKKEISSNYDKALNNKNTNRDWQFQFRYKATSPPKKNVDFTTKQGILRINKAMEAQTSQNFKLLIGGAGGDMLSEQMKNKSKYDFYKINKERIKKNEQQNSLIKRQIQKIENEQRNNLEITQMFHKFQKYKNIKSISTINQHEKIQQDFTYNLKSTRDQSQTASQLCQSFIYRSVRTQNYEILPLVEYFRDIGLAGRNKQKYSELVIKAEKKLEEPSNQDDQKQQHHLLHLLRQNELHIDKKRPSFYDLANISMGRITSSNAQLCIRSDRITKAQYQRLLRRLDRYQKQQRERGKKTDQIGINTDDNQNYENTHESQAFHKETNKEMNANEKHTKLVTQILRLRQECSKISKAENSGETIINVDLFIKQVNQRTQKLLKRLYNQIISDPKTYPLQSINQNLNILDEIILEDYKDGKLLWFIMDCYEEIAANMANEDTLLKLYKMRRNPDPKLLQYKGKKVVRQSQLGAQRLYTYKEKHINQILQNDRTPNKFNRSITPTKKMPKLQKQNGGHTPTKKKVGFKY